MLDDERAAGVFAVGADLVEGEDEGVAEGGEVGAEPAGSVERHVGAMDKMRVEGADDGAVGADDRARRIQVEIAEDLHGVAVATAGGDDDLSTGVFGEAESGEVARADATVAV